MKRRISAILATLSVAVAAMATYDCAPVQKDRELENDELLRQRQEKHWVDSVYAALTPRERVAQLFIPHLIVSDNAAGRAMIKKYVAGDHVGGLLLGRGDINSYAVLNGYAQSLADVPLMITADAEWGLSMRLKDAPRFPHNISLGATQDTAAIAAYGREMARECRRLGITVSFAPVADVNSNPLNPVIGFRSFGEDPQRVAALSVAYARGLEEGGVLSVGKHFPGHGDTSADSHKTLPVVSRSAEGLSQVELVPFKAIIDAGLGGIMVGHIKVPALDPSGTPASLSGRVISRLLKDKMGFDGLVFTDALEMAGAQVKGANNCVLALKAGADVLLGSAHPTADIDSVMAALASGRLQWTDVDTSVRKMLAYKYRLGLMGRQTVSKTNAVGDICSGQAEEVNGRLASAAITVVRNGNGLLPLSMSSKVVVVDAKKGFAEMAGKFGGSVSSVTDLTAADVKRCTAVVVPVYSDSRGMPAKLTTLRNMAGDKLIPVFFINPYKIASFATALKDLPTLVVVGDDTPALRRAAAEALFGVQDVTGRMPVNVKDVARLGEGVDLCSDRLGHAYPDMVGVSPALASEIDSLIDIGLAQKAFTGCQVMVVKDGSVIYDRAAGTIDDRKSEAVTRRSLFDLASVSKVVGTMAGLMAAYDRGMFKLDDRLDKFIPELKGDPKGALTMRGLMLHETGLPASVNIAKVVIDPVSLGGKTIYSPRKDEVHTSATGGMWGNRMAKIRDDVYALSDNGDFSLPVAHGVYASEAAYDTVMNRIMALPLNPSRAYRYSDVNFILLMETEQRMTGRRHDEWVDEMVYAPLGIERLTYRPLDLFERSEVVATENDKFLRKQKVHGYVHDETAAFMGGVAGNAGLFGNAESIAIWCDMLLDDGQYGGRQVLKPSTVKAFIDTRSADGGRGLGFDVTSDGRYIGHTGFTGTCFWIDPRLGVTVVVLTNRVNPSRDNKAWSRLNFRSQILDAVSHAFDSTPKV